MLSLFARVSLLVVAIASSGCCMGAASSVVPASAEVIGLGAPRLVRVGQPYQVEGTDVVLTPQSFTPLDTQAGHVMIAEVAAADGETRETLTLHARVPQTPGAELTWHGVGLEVTEEGFTYGGDTATLIATRAPTAATTCTVPGLESATTIAPIPLPDGCRFSMGGSFDAPRVVTTAEELASMVTCDAGAAMPPIDFDAVRVVVVTFSMSPAWAGTEIRDDGSAIVFVTRQRSPCPNDPLPMPMQSTLAFTLANASGERAFRQAVCTNAPDC